MVYGHFYRHSGTSADKYSLVKGCAHRPLPLEDLHDVCRSAIFPVCTPVFADWMKGRGRLQHETDPATPVSAQVKDVIFGTAQPPPGEYSSRGWAPWPAGPLDTYPYKAAMTMPGKSSLSEIQLKRIYEPLDAEDRLRVFVDRLWARGMSKADARLDAWMKELGPSDELREWFGHRAERWNNFQERYRRELSAPVRQLFLGLLQSAARASTVTLLYGARDTNQNEAVVLREYLLGHHVNLTQERDDTLMLAAAVAAVSAAQPSGRAPESSLLPFVGGLLSGPPREAAFLKLQDRGELIKGHGGWRLTARGQRLLRDVPAE